MKRALGVIFCGLLLSSCEMQDPLDHLCIGASAESYSADFQIWCPTQESDYYIPVRYGCSPSGQGVSPPIRWKGVPEGTTNLRIHVIDATCTYMCNSCCQYHHWVLDLPLHTLKGAAFTPDGISEGAAMSPDVSKYVLKNSSDKKEYMPFCPPKIQTHAYIFQAVAYAKQGGRVKVLGRSQSMPLLYSLEHR